MTDLDTPSAGGSAFPDAMTFHEVRRFADAGARIRLLGAGERLETLPEDPARLFRGAHRLIVLMVCLSLGCAILATVIVVLLVQGSGIPAFIVPVVLGGELLAAGALVVWWLRSRPASGRGVRSAVIDFGAAIAEDGVVERVWPNFYEGAFSELPLGVTTPSGAVLVGILGERRDPFLLPEQMPREGDPAYVWRTPQGATLVQVRLRRAGQSS